MVLRQAVHRLADVGLVRVRQGGATLVLDPGEAGDIRLIGLYYQLDPGGEHARTIRRDAIEKQSLQGLSLIDVCGRRGTLAEKRHLHELTLAFDDRKATEADFTAFEETFWRAVSRAGKNRIFEMEVVWWYDTLADGRPAVESAPPLSARIAFYRELARLARLGQRRDCLLPRRHVAPARCALREGLRPMIPRLSIAAMIAFAAVLVLMACNVTSEPTPSPAGGGLPCAVSDVLTRHCQSCHGSTPQYGAPMPLVTRADLLAPLPSNPARHVYEEVGVRIHDDAAPMPKAPTPRLEPSETATLDAFIAAAAPEAHETCAPSSAPDAGVKLSCTPDLHIRPAAPYVMPSDIDDILVCYGFESAVTAKRHIIALSPSISAARQLHHVTLLESDVAVSPIPGACAPEAMTAWRPLYGWAPGTAALELPAAAGFPQDAGTHFVVQLHFANPSHTPVSDTSGFDLCTTDQLRPNDADIMAFGHDGDHRSLPRLAHEGLLGPRPGRRRHHAPLRRLPAHAQARCVDQLGRAPGRSRQHAHRHRHREELGPRQSNLATARLHTSPRRRHRVEMRLEQSDRPWRRLRPHCRRRDVFFVRHVFPEDHHA